jgi:hypothetical protein
MSTHRYVCLTAPRARADGDFTVSHVIEASSELQARELVLAALDDETVKAGLTIVAIPTRYWRPASPTVAVTVTRAWEDDPQGELPVEPEDDNGAAAEPDVPPAG